MEIKSISFDLDEISIVPISDRWYKIPHDFRITIVTEKSGTMRYKIDPDFHFDARSGPKFVDYFIPEIGTQDLLKCWILHDLMAYDSMGFDFHEANDILHAGLIACGVSEMTADLVYVAVSYDDSYFGEPIYGTREFVNIDKIHMSYSDR